MKVTIRTNQELVIKARNEADYKDAMLVAQEMVKNGWVDSDIAATDDHEMYVHLCAVDDVKQAENFYADYVAAKKLLPELRK